jgi:hypothetical protein
MIKAKSFTVKLFAVFEQKRKEETTLAWKIDDAVSNRTLRDAKILLSEVSFRLGHLTPKTRVRLFRYPGDREVYFEQSHFFKIPDQKTSDDALLKSDMDEAYALTHAVEAFTHPYEAALEEGREPSDSWLILNDDY